MVTLTEKFHAAGFMVSEARGKRSRELGTVLSGQNLLAGTVLGAVTLGAASSAVKASGANTGTGTFVLDVTTPILANAIPGLYQLRCIEAVTNGGKFSLIDPRGLTVGGPYIIVAGAGGTVTIADRIKGVLTDAGTDFIVGDGFDITIAAGSGKYKAFDPAALDGSGIASAILWDDADATSADKKQTVVVRDAEVNASELVWGAGVTTDPQKVAALAQLAAVNGIVAR